MQSNTGYQVGGSASTSGGVGAPAKGEYWPLSKCRKAYLDYLVNKQEEIDEQKDSRRYYHGAQWTADQIKVLRDRRQPISTKNRIARKINGVVGLIERLRQDPKAYPRTPKHEEGAELATAVIRYVLDEQEWKAKSPQAALDGAIDGIGGIEIELEQGDQGDYEVAFDIVEPDSFFYDPRSYRADFSDARYMGLGKWMDVEAAQEMFPDHADEIAAMASDDSELSSEPDRENKWFAFDGGKQLIRIVDVWYRHKGEWCWALFTGGMVLSEGKSYLYDEKNKTICKYVMFSCNVDHDGDRYGFVRNMKSTQDGLNFKNSKLNFMMASRRLIMTPGAVEDIEKARKEWARPDGVVVVNTQDVNQAIKADDQSFDFTGLAKLLEEDKQELDGFGPNPALLGDAANQSGRAIQLLQQAGMAELGPYILGYRGWKIRVYRALFCAVQRYWTAERWIRVTDDEVLATITKLSVVSWKKRRPSLVRFFKVKDGVWTHSRIEKERAKAEDVGSSNSDKARDAAERRWAKDRERKLAEQAKQCSGDAPSINGALPQNAQSPSQSPSQSHVSFDEFWKAYPRRDSDEQQDRAAEEFGKLVSSGVDPAVIVFVAKAYCAKIRKQNNYATRYVKVAWRWLGEQDFSGSAAALPPEGPFVPADKDWHSAVKRWLLNESNWPRWAGNAPGTPSCRCPPGILAAEGVCPNTGRRLDGTWHFAEVDTPEMAANLSFASDHKLKVRLYDFDIDGVVKTGAHFVKRFPPGYDEATGEKIPTKAEDAA